MRILGVDPGYAIVGVGTIDYEGNRFRVVEFGAITTEAGEDMFDRLKAIYDEMTKLIEYVKPDVMAIEELFFQNNQKTAINVAQAVVGYGRAEKTQVQQMTKAILNLTEVPKPDDTADALAVAICHSHYAAYNSLSERLEDYK